MLYITPYFESAELVANLARNPALRQAAVWGLGSALGTKLSSGKRRKEMTKSEKRQMRRAIIGTGIAGALAGAAGHLVSQEKS